MLKSKYISLFLFLVFIVLQAHNLLPHHHHEHIEGIKKHHHDKQGHSHEDENDVLDLFHHVTHANTALEVIHPSILEHSIKKAATQIPFISEEFFLFKRPKIPPDRVLPAQHIITYTSAYFSSFHLRGPPAFYSVSKA